MWKSGKRERRAEGGGRRAVAGSQLPVAGRQWAADGGPQWLRSGVRIPELVSSRAHGLGHFGFCEPLMGFANGRSLGRVLRLIAAGKVGMGAR